VNPLRPVFVGMRATALADRRGFRWLIGERLWPAPIVVLHHRGRKSGKRYATPVEAINEDREERRIVVSPMRGKSGDWYRNIIAGGLEEVRLRGESFDAEWRTMSEQENKEALARYKREHPLYSRPVLWSLARGHGVKGDPITGMAREIPMLSVQLAPRDAASDEPGQAGSTGEEPAAAASRSSGAGR
jgi:deazaflavin-dependent oxidoreductase (nitroreductase family)